MRPTAAISILFTAALLAAALSGQEAAVYKGKEEKLPREVAPQPVLFNHARHAAAGVLCLDCHPGAAKQERATLPQTDKCMLCHQSVMPESEQVKKIRAAHEANEKLDWVRVYEVPGFVFFSHVNHVKAGVECQTCHGPVQQRQVLAQEVSTSMTACMNCHAAKQVSNHCHFCHTLGQ